MLYLLLLCIVIWRHIHARPNVYHARLRDHVQEVDHVTCVHKSGLYRNTDFMLVKRRQDGTPAPFLHILLAAHEQACSDS